MDVIRENSCFKLFIVSNGINFATTVNSGQFGTIRDNSGHDGTPPFFSHFFILLLSKLTAC